ncbi:MAG: hypothetical protein JWP01_3439 [Myxococcales bacterium]|nr:hypothetical protein [Myxococcales bacterium]
MERASSPSNARHLAVVAVKGNVTKPRLTRAQVASRLGASVSTVRRYEGAKLHPQADAAGVHWFDPAEVAALATERANDQRPGRRNADQRGKPAATTAGETAALAFERFEQRQSLAEIVVGLRLDPEVVRALFDQWTVGLTEGQLRLSREPTVARDSEPPRASATALAAQLAALPEAQATRISVARYRGPFQHGDREYADVVELGGFLVPGPCDPDQITQRYGAGDYRVTAYGFDPPGVRWELIVEDLANA